MISPQEHERLNALFGRMWHSVRTLKTPFAAGQECHKCDQPATRRIEVNIWGTVYEFDVCQACGERWNGKNVDDFPPKAKGASA